jgi:MFS family permease
MRASRWVALAVLCVGQLMAIIDQTIVNVALPSIQNDLGFSESGLAWVVNIYLVAVGALLLVSGWLGDIVGRRRVFLAGVVVFTIGSLLCGLASTQGFLLASRFVQGVGGALSTAVVLGMIFMMFPEPGDRLRAVGAFSFSAAAGGSVGTAVGGILTQAAGWHWVFLVNVPIGVAAVAVALRVLPRDEGAGGRIAVPWRLLRARRLAVANGVQVLLVTGGMGFMFLTTLYLQRILAFDPSRAGLAFLPAALTIASVSLVVAPRVIGRFGPRTVLLYGLGLMVVGMVYLARVPVAGHYALDVLPAMMMLGFGFGMAMPALTGVAMADAGPSDAGFASGFFNTTQQVGGAAGLAVLVAIFSGAAGSSSAAASSSTVDGYHAAYGTAAVLLGVAVVLVGLLLPGASPEVPGVAVAGARDDAGVSGSAGSVDGDGVARVAATGPRP